MAITLFGVCSVSLMLVTYALEQRSRHLIAAFALGCALSSAYGFLAGTWPFGVVEAVWTLVALRRYLGAASAAGGRPVPRERQTGSVDL